MDEIGKKDILELELEDGSVIYGHVYEYTKDRIAVKVDSDSVAIAKQLKELDKLSVVARTRFGIKNMVSHVIYELNNVNRMVIENASAATVEQKRENVRAVDNFEFKIKVDDKVYVATCLDISAGGIAFTCNDITFNHKQTVEIIFDEDIFTKQITCSAQIVKVHKDFCSAKYINLNVYDESKIAKRVFTILSGK